MKGLLFLGLVGAAIYALLVYTHQVLPRGEAEDMDGQTQPNQPVAQHLSSWGLTLRAGLQAKIRNNLLHCLRSKMLPMSRGRMTPVRIPSESPAHGTNLHLRLRHRTPVAPAEHRLSGLK